MKRAEEKKFKATIREIIGDNYKESDEVLITELADFISISIATKEKLKTLVKQDGFNGSREQWNVLSTLTMCSNQIQALMKALSITPQTRMKLAGKNAIQKLDVRQLNKFLNDN